MAAVGAEVAAATLQPAAAEGGQASGLGRLVDAVRLAGTATVGAVLVYNFGSKLRVLLVDKGALLSKPSGEQLLEQLLPEAESADRE